MIVNEVWQVETSLVASSYASFPNQVEGGKDLVKLSGELKVRVTSWLRERWS
jgi:hypothetical protein